jgi:NADH-quinone oxidoreductase subunit F
LICNADESEPGTFKDRQIMYKDPHQLIEGMIISCFANDVHLAYIYIRGEMPGRREDFESSLEARRARKIFSAKIFWAAATTWRFTSIAARAPTFAARKPA